MQVQKLPFFNVRHTLQCGQVFRYFESSKDVYCVISTDKSCLLKQNSQSVEIYTDDVEYFVNYFDCSTDYQNIEGVLSNFSELCLAIEFCRGLRILKQDLLETIVSFIISSNNNIGRITKSLNALCESYGQCVRIDIDGDKQSFYTFPNLQSLCQVSKKEWIEFGSGYRADYLMYTVRKLSDSDILSELIKLDYDLAYKKLLTLKGVGPKVANCIALFSLGHRGGFPVDTWIFKSLQTRELDTKQKVHDFYTRRYGNLSGYAQQYIFYFNREK
ncbi:MAG: hypothetical protein LBU60_02900 [Clostridiales bacterium]|jgi:N-glycosylase/DNA lyase|nr:hypothetical protein [Clostridiales bacterium]